LTAIAFAFFQSERVAGFASNSPANRSLMLSSGETSKTSLLDHSTEETAKGKRGTLMSTRHVLFAAAAIVAAVGAVVAMLNSAQALTMTECSAKYKDAKAAGTLNGATWNDFRKTQCDLAPRKRATSAAGSDSAVVAANAVFPTAVDSKYSNEKQGRARRKTCLDQYKANKATNANGGLKWLQKGGGYYSQCVKKLKGTA
jgi:hypothetical protein